MRHLTVMLNSKHEVADFSTLPPKHNQIVNEIIHEFHSGLGAKMKEYTDKGMPAETAVKHKHVQAKLNYIDQILSGSIPLKYSKDGDFVYVTTGREGSDSFVAASHRSIKDPFSFSKGFRIAFLRLLNCVALQCRAEIFKP